MIEYIKLFWEGAPEGEPSVILYEVDTENERLALRSIDIFADGRTRNIPALYLSLIHILVDSEMNQQVFILDLSFNPEITDELMVIYFDLNKEIFCITHES